MAQLPAANYLSDSARTEAEMQTALESLRDVIAEIGATDPQTLTISSGALPAPTSGMVLARSEGHSTGTDDVLDTITTTGIDQGRVIVLRNFDTTSTTTANTERITITHGTGAGQVELSDSADFILSGERMIAVIYSGTRWIELWRSYHRRNAEDVIAERTHLGLGDAATETIATSDGSSANDKVLKVGSSANLTANDLLAIDASGNIVAGSVTGGNADTLDSYDSTAFLRKADTATHTIAANVNITTAGASRFIANTTGTSQEPGLVMAANNTQRARVTYENSFGTLGLFTQDASGTQTPSLRLNPTNDRVEFKEGAGASWQSLRPGSGNGLDADTVDGSHASALLNVLSILDQSGGSYANGEGGSFSLSDGTTTLLVQWPADSDWVQSGNLSSGYQQTWTFGTAYASAPIALGSQLYTYNTGNSIVYSGNPIQNYAVSATSLSYGSERRTGVSNNYSYGYRFRTGLPIVIGIAAS